MASSGLEDVWVALGLLDAGMSLRDYLLAVVLCSARVYAAMLVLPATQDQLLTGVARNGLVILLAVFMAAGVPIGSVTSLPALGLVSLLLKEVFVGLLLGMAVSVVFWVAEGVGMLIDNIAGFNNIQQTNPMSSQSSTPMGNLLLQLAVVGFYALGGMTVFIGLLIDSYQWWPLQGAWPDWEHLLTRFVSVEVTRLFETMLRIAGPVLVTLVLIDIGIGLIAKAAEKLEPHSLSQPVKAAVAVLMIVLLVGTFFRQLAPELSLRPTVEHVQRQLAPAPAPAPAR